MDTYTSKKLVKDTFEIAFDKNRFYYFIKNLLNNFDETKAFHARGYVQEKYKKIAGIIKTYERIGTYIDPNENKIDILIVYLAKNDSLERARTTLRNFVADYLKNRDEKDAGLVAFVSPDNQDWRFSLIKMEYNLVASPTGKIKAKEEFTSAKRYSFLVGVNESSHTAQSRLVPILEDEYNPTLKQLEDAFNIEKVTDEFFEKYRELFLKVRESLDVIIEKDEKINFDFEQKGVNTVDFSKKLLGQIVFLYFLQKKGWFGVERDSDWGTGPKNFLRLLFDLPAEALALPKPSAKRRSAQAGKMIANYKNFFNDILEPLFYEALAKERDKDFYSRFNCKTPFLNGGLFDPLSDYDWVHTDILLPDDLFSNHVRTKEGDIGTGILDIFDRYNFTVKEDEPLEKEVAVDPEMLGKVFENLLEVKDRKSKGTYYTPREIVHYMCQESLINYLVNECEGKVNRKDIETLIQYGETAVEHDSRVEQEGKETETYSYKLPESVRKNAQLLDDKLKNIRVCDPAIGSGAFPVGMMNEIIRTRNTLTNYLDDKKDRSIYSFKRDAIQNSLYGVDIDPGAVEIAKLRLWLSLIVDEQDIKQIKPLPNLDYKIMQGNSLLEEFEGVRIFDERLLNTSIQKDDKRITELKVKEGELSKRLMKYYQQKPSWMNKKALSKPIELIKLEKEMLGVQRSIKYEKQPASINGDQVGLNFNQNITSFEICQELQKLHDEFLRAYDRKLKLQRQKDIEDLNWRLIETTLKEQNKSSELKKLEVFKRSNTKPFFLWKLHFSEVFQEKGGFDVIIANPPYVRQEKIKDQKTALQTYEVYNSTSDLYTYFYERSYNLLRSKGILTFISSNKWMRAKYGERLRRFFRERTNIKQLIDFNGHKVFEATVDTNIIIFQKEVPTENYIVPFVNIQSDFNGEKINQYLSEHQQSIGLNQLRDGGWSLENEQILVIKEKIEKAGIPLKSWGLKSYMGIKTGFNEAFIIDERRENELVKMDPKNLRIVSPLLKGKDIGRYYLKFNSRYLILAKNGINVRREYPSIFKHLAEYKEQLDKRWDKGKHWSNLRDCVYYGEFEKAKIIYPDINERLSFSYDDNKYYSDNTAYILGTDNKYILAILNSSLINFYYGFISSQLGSRAVRHFTIYIEQIPITQVPDSEQKPFIEIVDKILAITNSSDYLTSSEKQARVRDYERQIDQLVYRLYGLTSEEIAIVEGRNEEIR